MHIYKFDTQTKTMIWGREEWILSSVPQSESVVTSPTDEEGMTLQHLIDRYGARFMGKANYTRSGSKFPLLVKFIFANQDLSIQVHPADEYAMKHHGCLGKNEMWYLLDASPETRFRVGFNQTISAEEYERRIADSTILDVLNEVPVGKGDVIYLPAGRVHSIGGGSSLLEVQQSSDITYRIFDFNRTDKDGNPRELHTQRAKEVLDYQTLTECKLPYSAVLNKETVLVDVPYFTTSLLSLDRPLTTDLSAIDSFVLYICTKGCATLVAEDGCRTVLNERDIALVPAEMNSITIEPEESAEIVKVQIQ